MKKHHKYATQNTTVCNYISHIISPQIQRSVLRKVSIRYNFDYLDKNSYIMLLKSLASSYAA